MPSDDRATVSQLAVLRRELEQARRHAHAVADSAGPEAWSRRPASGGWSAAECVVHLNLTSGRFVRLGSPFAERVRDDVPSAIVAVHQRRHLWQAERGLASLG
jgi:hypothetical protein